MRVPFEFRPRAVCRIISLCLDSSGPTTCLSCPVRRFDHTCYLGTENSTPWQPTVRPSSSPSPSCSCPGWQLYSANVDTLLCGLCHCDSWLCSQTLRQEELPAQAHIHLTVAWLTSLSVLLPVTFQLRRSSAWATRSSTSQPRFPMSTLPSEFVVLGILSTCVWTRE